MSEYGFHRGLWDFYMLTQLSQTRRAVIYARVSTSSQTVENQISELRDVAMRNGWRITLELTDNGISGSKGRDQRPAFNDLIHRATRREFDIVMVWAIDRLGRSIQQLVEFMNELQWQGIDLYCHQQAINTATPAGRMVFSIFSALGEYERELIRERIIAGQRRARGQGIRIGRPSKMNDAVRTSVKLLRDKGMSIREIAKRLEIGVGTVYSVLKSV
jgi:DNA invertase Pin-like site-specific DNA recombinase